MISSVGRKHEKLEHLPHFTFFPKIRHLPCLKSKLKKKGSRYKPLERKK